jgi:hypothetical protein
VADRKKLMIFLALEIVVLATVIMIFRLVPEKFVAGMVGGICFVSLGIGIGFQCRRSVRLRWSATFLAAMMHLFLTSLPLMLTRMMNYGTDFSEIRVLGLSGPTFHSFSSAVYMILILATVFDLIRLWKRTDEVSAT